MYKNKKLKAFSLVELIIAIGIFSIAISSFAFLGIEAYRTLRTSQSKIAASQKTKEITDLIMLVKNESWANIVDNTDDGPKHIFNNDGFLFIEDGSLEENGLTYFFTITNGYRDENGQLIETAPLEYEDISTRIVNLTIIFENKILSDHEYNTKIYINNWNTLKISQDTKEDFDEGENLDTDILPDGEIELVKKSLSDFPDWCTPQHTHSKFPLPAGHTATKLTASPGFAYFVTGFDNSAATFLLTEISTSNPPVISLIDTLKSNAKSYDVHFDGTYVYFSTNRHNESVVILDPTTKPFTKVGEYQTGVQTDALAIYTSGNYGFVGYQNKIDIFDLSSQIMTKPKITTINIGTSSTQIRGIVVKDNYLFAAIGNHTTQLAIVDLSNITSPTIVKQMTLNNASANAVFVSEDTNTTYVGTASSTTTPEFFVINTTNKSNPSLTSSFETNGMSIADITIVENRAILGGSGATNNYIVLLLDDLENPNKCGELLIDGNVLSLSAVEYNNKLFTYVLTNKRGEELQIIEGGKGLAGIGDDYVNDGQYFSKIFDTNSPSIRFYSTHVYGTQPTGTTLKVQFRVGTEPELTDSTWFGPDGTSNTHFVLGDNEINLPAQPGRYFQYKVEMTSDSIEISPVLSKIEIIYD